MPNVCSKLALDIYRLRSFQTVWYHSFRFAVMFLLCIVWLDFNF